MTRTINKYGEKHKYYMGSWKSSADWEPSKHVWRVGDYNISHPEFLIKKLISMRILLSQVDGLILVIVPILNDGEEPDFTNAVSLTDLTRRT